MEFLVAIDVKLPPETPAERRADLVAAEAVRARELAETGVIVRLWRIPGRWSNVGLWVASDASALHEALSSLPLYPWLDVKVTALARHPSDPGLPGAQ